MSLAGVANEIEKYSDVSDDTAKAYSLLQNIDDELETVKSLVENAAQSLDYDPDEKEK